MIQFQPTEAFTLLGNGSKANTTAATGTGITFQGYTGDIMVTQAVGAITGTLDGVVQWCSDSAGTGAVTVGTFTQVTTANDDPNLQKLTVPLSSMPAGKPFLRYLGTIVTGPSVVTVVAHAIAEDR
jgi:hypothetical protein